MNCVVVSADYDDGIKKKTKQTKNVIILGHFSYHRQSEFFSQRLNLYLYIIYL